MGLSNSTAAKQYQTAENFLFAGRQEIHQRMCQSQAKLHEQVRQLMHAEARAERFAELDRLASCTDDFHHDGRKRLLQAKQRAFDLLIDLCDEMFGQAETDVALAQRGLEFWSCRDLATHKLRSRLTKATTLVH